MNHLCADKSGIPEELRRHPEVLELESQVLSQYSDPEARKCTCVHEAAHQVYFRKIGIKTSRRGPCGFYDEATQECYFANAMVYPANYSDLPNAVDIQELARAYAAGIVAAKELTLLGARETTVEAQNMGLGSDFYRFAQACKLMFEKATDREIKNTFEQAKAVVKIELHSPELQAEIWRFADEFGREIFGEGCEPRGPMEG